MRGAAGLWMGALVVVAVEVVGGSVCRGQGAGAPEKAPPAAVDPAKKGTPEDPGVLRGPAVNEGDSRQTLVHKDFGGTLEPLDVRPEEGALELLGLTKDELAPARAILTERGAKVSEFTLGHYELFQKFLAARDGGASREEMRPIMRELAEEGRELLDPPLEERVAESLPEGSREKFHQLVKEYKAAQFAADEERRAKKEGGEKKDGEAGGRDGMEQSLSMAPMVQRRVEIGLLVREMGRSFRSFVADRREKLDELLKAVDATPEQENTIRRMVRELGAESKLRPTERQRGELWMKIMRELTQEQREKARRLREGMSEGK